jgi:hypothetical protein
MRLVDYLGKGASLDPDAACLTTDQQTRNRAAENRELLYLFGCRALVFQVKFAGLVAQIRGTASSFGSADQTG